MIPVAGFLEQRAFLNLLAFKIFSSTQYIRHHSKPFYSPEPDVVHEMMGHVPLFTSKDFVDFSQRIGLASLCLSEETLKELAAIYFWTVEFGLVRENSGQMKAYGAGLLACAAELEYVGQGGGVKKRFDPNKASKTEYVYTNYQPMYWWGDSLEEIKERVNDFIEETCGELTIVFDEKNDKVRFFKDVDQGKAQEAILN
jgi:phenylalanine-4-hydroxylase